jgi:L,D-peptidoglycan transpeptidase YkuD (ErfK/YbiS/YcfS/YnhG family)
MLHTPAPGLIKARCAAASASHSRGRVLTVKAARTARHRGTAVLGGRAFACALGPSGIVRDKREGDGATPRGCWPVRCVLYRPDRVARPRTGLPVIPLAPCLGWCDDVSDRRYNGPVSMPCTASAEPMWRDDHLYDVVVVLGHNDAPPVAGRGSCIFFHLARPDYGPTQGCIAVCAADMVRIIADLGPGARIRIAG